MTRRPPSLRRLAILLTLPVLLVAGMGVWVVIAERARVEGDAVKEASVRAERAVELLRTGEVEKEMALRSAFMPRWRFYGEPMPEQRFPFDQYREARRLISADKGQEAAALLRQLVETDGVEEAHSPAGLPVLPLLHRALMDAEPAEVAGHARMLCAASLRLPSILTAKLVEDARPALSPDDLMFHDLDAANTAALLSRLAPHAGKGLTLDGSGWFDLWHVAFPAPDLVMLTQPHRAAEAVSAALDGNRRRPLADIAISWHGRELIRFGSTGHAASVREDGPWRVAALIPPDVLEARIAERTNFLKWVLANVLLAVAVAMWMTFRAFKKQAALARMQGEFVASVSHELRTPVAGIGALAERLESGTADAAQTAEYHRMIAREGRRLAALVDNVLDFSRIERGAKAYDLEHADLPRLIRETAALLRPVAEEKGLTLVEEIAEVPEDRWPAVDAVALRQALVNLLDNAIKFTPPGGTVTVGFGQPGQSGQIRLFVKDTGISIPATEQARIFEKFYRVDNGLRRETTGAGIGLSIVRHIAEGHGARVSVESEAGKGAVFTLHFPPVPGLKS